VFRRLAVNKTILKPRLAVATGGQYVYVGFSRRNKIELTEIAGQDNDGQTSRA